MASPLRRMSGGLTMVARPAIRACGLPYFSYDEPYAPITSIGKNGFDSHMPVQNILSVSLCRGGTDD